MHWPLREASANAAKSKVKGCQILLLLSNSYIFKSAFPAEAMTSSVLLQRFLTGLRLDISRQLFLCSRPTTFTAVVKDATDVEYALEFGGEEVRIHAMRPTQPTPELSNAAALHQKLDTLTKRL